MSKTQKMALITILVGGISFLCFLIFPLAKGFPGIDNGWSVLFGNDMPFGNRRVDDFGSTSIAAKLACLSMLLALGCSLVCFLKPDLKIVTLGGVIFFFLAVLMIYLTAVGVSNFPMVEFFEEGFLPSFDLGVKSPHLGMIIGILGCLIGCASSVFTFLSKD